MAVTIFVIVVLRYLCEFILFSQECFAEVKRRSARSLARPNFERFANEIGDLADYIRSQSNAEKELLSVNWKEDGF